MLNHTATDVPALLPTISWSFLESFCFTSHLALALPLKVDANIMDQCLLGSKCFVFVYSFTEASRVSSPPTFYAVAQDYGYYLCILIMACSLGYFFNKKSISFNHSLQIKASQITYNSKTGLLTSYDTCFRSKHWHIKSPVAWRVNRKKKF